MKLNNSFILRQVGQESIIVEPNQGMVDFSKVFTLNESAAFLWNELVGSEFEENDAVQKLLDHYDVDEDQARKDVTAILERFREHKMVIE